MPRLKRALRLLCCITLAEDEVVDADYYYEVRQDTWHRDQLAQLEMENEAQEQERALLQEEQERKREEHRQA